MSSHEGCWKIGTLNRIFKSITVQFVINTLYMHASCTIFWGVRLCYITEHGVRTKFVQQLYADRGRRHEGGRGGGGGEDTTEGEDARGRGRHKGFRGEKMPSVDFMQKQSLQHMIQHVAEHTCCSGTNTFFRTQTSELKTARFLSSHPMLWLMSCNVKML